MRLQERVVIVTGGAHGIGAAFCRGLAREGAAVAVADVDGPGAEALARDIEATGGRATGVPTDVSSEESTLAMARAVQSRWGRIDALINNAAVFRRVPVSRGGILEIPPAEWDRLMEVNLRGPFLCARAVLPAMRARRQGAIVNMASDTALSGRPHFIHYVSSKAGLMGFTRCLAREVGPDGIRVNAIAPGLTLSDPEPTDELRAYHRGRIAGRALERIEQPEDLVGTAVFLVSDDSAFITGQTIAVNGGFTMH